MNGAHDGEKLQEILDDFIQKFVLCPECENPETVLVRLFIGFLQFNSLAVNSIYQVI